MFDMTRLHYNRLWSSGMITPVGMSQMFSLYKHILYKLFLQTLENCSFSPRMGWQHVRVLIFLSWRGVKKLLEQINWSTRAQVFRLHIASVFRLHIYRIISSVFRLHIASGTVCGRVKEYLTCSWLNWFSSLWCLNWRDLWFLRWRWTWQTTSHTCNLDTNASIPPLLTSHRT